MPLFTRYSTLLQTAYSELKRRALEQHVEVFAWHKMLVSQLRGETREKRAKDIEQAAVLVAVLAEDEPDALGAAFDALPRSARAGAGRVVALLEKGQHASGAAVIRGIV